MDRPMRRAKRVLVVGLDGANWDLLSRLATDGLMPHLAELQRKSRWGALESTIPPITPTAWSALSTGMNPGKTGLYSFYVPKDSIVNFRATTSLDVRQETLPELLERHGYKVHVINLPTFSYPKKIKGTVLGDILCPPEYSVQPKSLLEKDVYARYRSFPNMSLKHDLRAYIEDIRKVERARFDCARDLFSTDWDFLFVMFSGVDWVQHEIYSDLLNGARTKATSAGLAFYNDLDSYLGWFTSKLTPDDYLIIASDHGFRRSIGSFNINVWLQSIGLLHTRARSTSGLDLSRSWGLRIPDAVLRAATRHRTLWRIGVNVWRSVEGRSGFAGRLKVDSASTLAFSQDTSWGIRLNSKRRFKEGILDEAGEQEAMTKIKSGLDKLAGAGIIKGYAPVGEVYSGPYVSEGPDLILFELKRGFNALGTSVIGNLPGNGHSMDGIFLLHGAGVKPNQGERASIYDIFPTVLTLFGVGVPTECDGTSLVEGQEGSEASMTERSGAKSLTPREEEQIEARLKSLGYI